MLFDPSMAFLVVGGGLGGFIAALRANNANKLAFPLLKEPRALGFLGDIIIGCCAAVVAYAVLGVIPCEITQHTAFLDARLAGFGIAAGFAGIKVLETASFDLLKRQQEELDRTVKLNRLLAEGDRYYGEKLYQLAVDSFEKAVALDPNSLEAKMGLAVSMSFIPGMEEKAISLLSGIIGVNAQSARAWYNRACIKAHINKGRDAPKYPIYDILSDLQHAISLSEIWRGVARSDPDFSAIGDSPDFQELMRPPVVQREPVGPTRSA